MSLLLRLLTCVAAAMILHGDAEAAMQRPNLILIYADDLGYGDPECYGGKLVPTPYIDSLATAGVRFTDGYVTAPACAPSRCGLMTGAYNQRFGIQGNEDQHIGPRQYRIPETHKLLPETLRASGYRTGLIGKWNLPRNAKTVFDEAFEVMDWEGDYFPGPDGRYFGVDDTNHASAKVQGVWGPARPDDEYMTDRIGRRAVEFIEKNRQARFFLYCAFNAVHTPLHAKTQDQAHFAHVSEEPLRFYAAMLASLDENVGHILTSLRKSGLETNTIVGFVSDNGPAMGSDYIQVWRPEWPKKILLGSAGPLRGHKAQYYEGGIRVPYLLRWPARLKAGSVYRQPVSTMDLYATFCAAAGVPIPAGTTLNGVNLLPFLDKTASGAPHETLFWMSSGQGAVRRGDWKLVISSAKPQFQLFNLTEDVGETRDIAAEKSEIRDALHQAWLEWQAPFPPRSNPPTKKLSGTVAGRLVSKEVRMPDGKSFNAFAICDDKGVEHLIYFRLLKPYLQFGKVHELAGQSVRVTGERMQTGTNSVFNSVDAFEQVP